MKIRLKYKDKLILNYQLKTQSFMKQITLLIAACCLTAMSFAAGGSITYELNGGVTNDYGWKNKNDMYLGLNAAWNTFSGTTVTWKSLDVLIAEANGIVANAVPAGIPTQAATMDKPFILDANVKADWQWLVDYMDAACVAQSKALSSTGGAALRYNLSTFFLSSVRTGWPASPDYAVLGQPEAFIPHWKKAFAGPATYDGSAEVIIPSPYKEGFTFDGWYNNAAFEGNKITSIAAGTEGNITLYAKWIEYIPTVAEVKALTEGATSKAGGIITYVNGTTAYMQDATGGLMLEFATAPSIVVGNRITVSGTTAVVGTYRKLTNATLLSTEIANIPTVQTITLATLKADAATYIFEYINIQGLTIVSYGANNTVNLIDDADNTIVLHATLNQTALPANTKVNVRAIVSFDSEIVLISTADNVTAAPVPRPDGVTYTPLHDGKYTLANRWLVSHSMDNFTANKIGTTNFVRGMTAKNGKMYFIDREHKQFTIIDGATGARLAPLKFASNIFTYTENDEVKTAGQLPFNDVKQDNTGNVLVANGITSNLQPFQVWKIDMETGNGTLVLQDILKNNPDYAEANIRFDAFGVYGDVTNNAIIMALNANKMEAYKWEITNGVAGPAEVIIIATDVDGTFLKDLGNPGYAPQIFPVDENFFYIDGNATLPTLIDMAGNTVDGFYNVPTEVEDWNVGIANKQGHNGLMEFELGGEHFFIIASTNTLGTPPSAFRLFKWADASKEFKDLESLWTLPAAGMGAASNEYRTAMPVVEVDEANKLATIYLYTGENGYGVYEFRINDVNSVRNTSESGVTIKQSKNNILVSEYVARIELINTAGQRIASVTNSNMIATPSTSGVYIVNITDKTGARKMQKVVIQ